jgi:predicted kinase
MIIYICVGLPGSGKSTWSRAKVEEDRLRRQLRGSSLIDISRGTVIISNDYFRTMLTGSYLFDHRYEKLVQESSQYVLVRSLKMGFDVIYDEIGITKVDRSIIIAAVESISSHCRKVCVWFRDRSVDDSGNVIDADYYLNRRMQDSRGVSRERWRVIIDEMKSKFEVPDMSEGFDEIIVV